MHELSICQALMDQVDGIAREHGAVRVASIQLGIGALSGVEPQLLADAFPIASAGSRADGAELIIKTLPVVVNCQKCGSNSEALPSRLVCDRCGNWQTTLVSGDELELTSIELITGQDGNQSPDRGHAAAGMEAGKTA